ncbi:MAG: hypothetical protein KAT74_12875, partial [Candidatus Cloacimonetes bacterium]|nr:hypothetical protein [Candidatus Cloacimonadota bacterium]
LSLRDLIHQGVAILILVIFNTLHHLLSGFTREMWQSLLRKYTTTAKCLKILLKETFPNQQAEDLKEGLGK